MSLATRRVAVLCMATFLIPLVQAADDPKVDPQTGLIRVLFLGDALMEAGHLTPFIHQDPMMALTRIPYSYLFVEHDARLLRLYLPRHEGQFYEGLML